jgi:hypothetical protein
VTRAHGGKRADGDGAGAAIQFATLTGAPTLIADDFIIGG